jgi:hypothetical protein
MFLQLKTISENKIFYAYMLINEKKTINNN